MTSSIVYITNFGPAPTPELRESEEVGIARIATATAYDFEAFGHRVAFSEINTREYQNIDVG
jgi:hypothetical protein